MPTYTPPPQPKKTLWPVLIPIGIGVALVITAAVIVLTKYRPLPKRTAEDASAVRDETRAAFTGRAQSTADVDTANVTAALEKFNSALKARNDVEGGKTVDMDRLYAELLRVDGVQAPPVFQQGDFKKGLRTGVLKIFTPTGTMNPWDKADVRLVKNLDTPDDCVVTARLHYPEYVQPMRFWLHKTDAWRVYDWEDLSLGLRATSIMGRMMASNDTLGLTQRLQGFIGGIRQQNAGDLKGAQQSFAAIDRRGLPADLTAAVDAAEGSALLQLGKPADALPKLQAAATNKPDSPMVQTLLSAALYRTGDYAGAERAGRAGVALLGPDGLASYNLAHALTKLGRKDEAVRVLRDGLATDPDSGDCMAGLAEALPPENGALVGDYFAKSTITPTAYRALANTLDQQSHASALKSVAEAYAKANGPGIDSDFYTAAVLFDEGHPAEAAALYAKHLDTTEKFYVRGIKSRYAQAKAAAEKAATQPAATQPANAE